MAIDVVFAAWYAAFTCSLTFENKAKAEKKYMKYILYVYVCMHA